jgi:hypothetical protein
MEYLLLIGLIINIILTITFMEEMKALIGRLQSGVTNIKNDITEIKNNLPPTGGLTAEQVAELKADLTAAVQQVEDLDAENPGTTPV